MLHFGNWCEQRAKGYCVMQLSNASHLLFDAAGGHQNTFSFQHLTTQQARSTDATPEIDIGHIIRTESYLYLIGCCILQPVRPVDMTTRGHAACENQKAVSTEDSR